jgi:uncharacterized protein (TIGR00255 family)
MHSMTGFGRGAQATSEIVVHVEASSVNRKQGEVSLHMPRALGELESHLRKRVLQHISRGRATVQIKLDHPQGVAAGVQLDEARAKALNAAFTDLSETLGRQVLPDARVFLQAPDVFTFEEVAEPEAILPAVEAALDEALNALVAMRKSEGADLKSDLLQRLQLLEQETAFIEEKSPGVVSDYRDTLMRRLGEAGLDLDLNDERVLKEIAIFADRCDITEETTRLRSHFRKFHEYLDSGNAVGRSLDFLCQELNREFNTIGSKANDATLAQHVVSAKTELEKMREQVQNVE